MNGLIATICTLSIFSVSEPAIPLRNSLMLISCSPWITWQFVTK